MRTLAWISREIGIRWQLEMGQETGFLLVCAAPVDVTDSWGLMLKYAVRRGVLK